MVARVLAGAHDASAAGWGAVFSLKQAELRQKRDYERSFSWLDERVAHEEAPTPRGEVETAAAAAGSGGLRLLRRESSRWMRVKRQYDAVAELQRATKERADKIAAEADKKLLEQASQSSYGDARTVASAASGKEWRGELRHTHQIRSEIIRRWFEDNPEFGRQGGAARGGDHQERGERGEKLSHSPLAWLLRDYPTQPPRGSRKRGAQQQSKRISAEDQHEPSAPTTPRETSSTSSPRVHARVAAPGAPSS